MVFGIHSTKNKSKHLILKDLELDWQVVKVPIMSSPKTKPKEYKNIEMPEYAGIVREDTGYPLSIMGSKYCPIQNKEALDLFDPLLSKHLVTIDYGGYFKYGKKAWISANFRDIVLDSIKIVGNIRVEWSHDGSLALTANFMPIAFLVPYFQVDGWDKEVRLPAFIAANPAIYGQFSIKHTKKAHVRMEKAYNMAVSFFNGIENFYNNLSQTPFDIDRVEKILLKIYPEPPQKRETKKGTPIISFNEHKRQAIIQVCKQFLKTLTPTKLCFTLAFAYYYDYLSRVRLIITEKEKLELKEDIGKRIIREEQQRLLNSWYGSAGKEKIKFLKEITNA